MDTGPSSERRGQPPQATRGVVVEGGQDHVRAREFFTIELRVVAMRRIGLRTPERNRGTDGPTGRSHDLVRVSFRPELGEVLDRLLPMSVDRQPHEAAPRLPSDYGGLRGFQAEFRRCQEAVFNLKTFVTALGLLLPTLGCGAEPNPGGDGAIESEEPVRIRIALFNIRELGTDQLTAVDEAGVGTDTGVRAAATIVQRIRPDILVINEIDHDYTDGEGDLTFNAVRFAEAYLGTGENPLEFEYAFAAPNNTSILSGLDLNGDGIVATADDLGTRAHGDDSFGYGEYPGQYSMALLSRFPVDRARVRTFQNMLWADYPGQHIPPSFYSDEVLSVFRLSSKSHWDVPVELGGGRTLHLFVSHPTPPVFDGDEDRNGRRNFDEVGFWAEYLDDGSQLYDDEGGRGGFRSNTPFVIAGDLNARPDQTESIYDGIPAIRQLLDHPRVQDSGPYTTSEGALMGREPGPPAWVERGTADFGGGARVDYLLPSIDVELVAGGVFWPDENSDPEGARLAAVASDHRLVWIDLIVR